MAAYVFYVDTKSQHISTLFELRKKYEPGTIVELIKEGKLKTIKLNSDDECYLTDRVFPGCFTDRDYGEEYTSEWAERAESENGDIYQIIRQFPANKGQEPGDDEWPWTDESYIYQIKESYQNNHKKRVIMKLSQIEELKKFCKNLHSEPDYKEVLEHIESDDTDFEVNNVRFIRVDKIDKVQQEELANDLYTLGCFNTEFLAEVLDFDIGVLDVMVEDGAFRAIGKLILSLGKLEEVQKAYSTAEGYSHHFGGDTLEELDLGDNEKFLVFDNH